MRRTFACLVLRAVAATAIFVALAAGTLACQKDARNERPYIFLLVFRGLRWLVKRAHDRAPVHFFWLQWG